MKCTIMLAGLFILFSNTGYSQDTGPKVTIKNLEGKTGQVYIGWYNSAAAFASKQKAIFKKIVKVTGQYELSVPFEAIPPGKYAIAVYLDENGNGVIDKNILGIPKEKYGFSNNASPAMRAPRYEEAVFEMSGKENIEIKLK